MSKATEEFYRCSGRFAQAKGYQVWRMKDYKTIFEKVESALISAGSQNLSTYNFTWDESKACVGNTAYIIPTNDKWLLGLLNSQLIWRFYLNVSSTIRGGFVRFIAQYVEQLPIPAISDKQKAPIIECVQSIFAITKDEDYLENPAKQAQVKALEREIDQMVYQLYSLTEEEIRIVEGKG